MIQLFRPSYDVDACLQSIREVLESGWTGSGPKCQAFEKKFCEKTGAKFAHYVSSATAGLHLAVKILDLPPGSKIVSTPLTFVSSNAVILYEDHIPVFADIDPRDLSLNADSVIQNVLNHDAKAVIWVHYSGNVSSEFYKFMEWRRQVKPKLHVIEDCAHAMGAEYECNIYLDGVSFGHVMPRVGSRNDTISVFSFQAVKNLPTADSGMIVVPDAEMLERVKKLAWLGIDKSTYTRTGSTTGNELYKWKYTVDELGWKYNGNDIMAAIALVQIESLDMANAYRKQIYSWYKTFLKLPVLIEQEPNSSHHLVVIKADDRERIMGALKSAGYAPGVHYLPNYEFPVFEKFYKKGDCKNCESISEQIVSLPNHLKLTRQDVEKICEVINSVMFDEKKNL